MSFPDVNRSGLSSHLKKKKRLIHESHPQENETFTSTLSQFSRADSLLFKDRSFSCTLDLIDLVNEIQSFQNG